MPNIKIVISLPTKAAILKGDGYLRVCDLATLPLNTYCTILWIALGQIEML